MANEVSLNSTIQVNRISASNMDSNNISPVTKLYWASEDESISLYNTSEIENGNRQSWYRHVYPIYFVGIDISKIKLNSSTTYNAFKFKVRYHSSEFRLMSYFHYRTGINICCIYTVNGNTDIISDNLMVSCDYNITSGSVSKSYIEFNIQLSDFDEGLTSIDQIKSIYIKPKCKGCDHEGTMYESYHEFIDSPESMDICDKYAYEITLKRPSVKYIPPTNIRVSTKMASGTSVKFIMKWDVSSYAKFNKQCTELAEYTISEIDPSKPLLINGRYNRNRIITDNIGYGTCRVNNGVVHAIAENLEHGKFYEISQFSVSVLITDKNFVTDADYNNAKNANDATYNFVPNKDLLDNKYKEDYEFPYISTYRAFIENLHQIDNGDGTINLEFDTGYECYHNEDDIGFMNKYDGIGGFDYGPGTVMNWYAIYRHMPICLIGGNGIKCNFYNKRINTFESQDCVYGYGISPSDVIVWKDGAQYATTFSNTKKTITHEIFENIPPGKYRLSTILVLTDLYDRHDTVAQRMIIVKRPKPFEILSSSIESTGESIHCKIDIEPNESNFKILQQAKSKYSYQLNREARFEASSFLSSVKRVSDGIDDTYNNILTMNNINNNTPWYNLGHTNNTKLSILSNYKVNNDNTISLDYIIYNTDKTINKAIQCGNQYTLHFEFYDLADNYIELDLDTRTYLLDYWQIRKDTCSTLYSLSINQGTNKAIGSVVYKLVKINGDNETTIRSGMETIGVGKTLDGLEHDTLYRYELYIPTSKPNFYYNTITNPNLDDYYDTTYITYFATNKLNIYLDEDYGINGITIGQDFIKSKWKTNEIVVEANINNQKQYILDQNNNYITKANNKIISFSRNRCICKAVMNDQDRIDSNGKKYKIADNNKRTGYATLINTILNAIGAEISFNKLDYWTMYDITVTATDGYNYVSKTIRCHTDFPYVHIYLNNEWHRAIPYIYYNSQWNMAAPYLFKDNEYKLCNGEKT